MISYLAVLPALMVLVAVLALRLSGLVAASMAVACAVAIAVAEPFRSLTSDVFAHSMVDAAILTLTAAAMIVPGVLFVEVTRRQGAADALAGLVVALDMPPARRAIFIVVGLGVLIESMTGMGVSLLVTIPLLLAMTNRREAIGLALVGMSLMPWGALGISAIVGIKLAEVEPDVFALAVSRVSGAIAFLLPLLCLAFVPERTVRDAVTALAVGAVLLAAIVFTTMVSGLELAGVGGGLAAMAGLTAMARKRALMTALLHPGLLPYAVLIAAVLAQKLLLAAVALFATAPVISSGRMSFALLSSPGLALVTATLLASSSVIDRGAIRASAGRAWRPIASIALFMLSARLLVECGAIQAMAASLSSLGPIAAALATVLLGAVSGFVTGSGVSGNALFMPAAAETGRALGQLPLFAALQNGAAGHTAMSSLPIAAILLAALPNRTSADDRMVLRLGLALAGVYVAVLCCVAVALAR